MWVGDRLLPREMAKVSVLDSAVQGGDAVWEGLRVYDGRVFQLDQHLDRLMDSAKAMDFKGAWAVAAAVAVAGVVCVCEWRCVADGCLKPLPCRAHTLHNCNPSPSQTYPPRPMSAAHYSPVWPPTACGTACTCG